ncbi:hypothetical protein FACS1894169_04760 [Bacteroidia bacterium]|nr:hypothetical protein FACS1894169_04760 [Bacteroidia bacterium]
MTDDFMLQLAKEYMQEMGIKNTQYIIVRHHNTDNEHLHIVYNRIDNNLKLISVNNDYKRNIKVCRKLKDKYNLTYGKGKEKVKREKLDNPDKIKYYIHDAIKAVLPSCKTPADLRFALLKSGIELEYKLKRITNQIEGVSFRYDNISFKGSQIDRKFSFGNLQKEFEKNIEEAKKQGREEYLREQAEQKTQDEAQRKPKTDGTFTIGGIKLSSEQMLVLKDEGYVYLENMQKKDGSKLSAYLFFDSQIKQHFLTKQNPESFVKYGQYEMRLMDKMKIEAGFITKAKVKWWGGGYAYPYLWKTNKADIDYQESWGDPRIPKTQKIGKKPQSSTIQKKNSRGRSI